MITEPITKTKETDSVEKIIKNSIIIGYNMNGNTSKFLDVELNILDLNLKSEIYIMIEPNYSLKDICSNVVNYYVDNAHLNHFESNPESSKLELSDDNKQNKQTILMHKNLESLMFSEDHGINSELLKSSQKILAFKAEDYNNVRDFVSKFEDKYGKIQNFIIYDKEKIHEFYSDDLILSTLI